MLGRIQPRPTMGGFDADQATHLHRAVVVREVERGDGVPVDSGYIAFLTEPFERHERMTLVILARRSELRLDPGLGAAEQKRLTRKAQELLILGDEVGFLPGDASAHDGFLRVRSFTKTSTPKQLPFPVRPDLQMRFTGITDEAKNSRIFMEMAGVIPIPIEIDDFIVPNVRMGFWARLTVDAAARRVVPVFVEYEKVKEDLMTVNRAPWAKIPERTVHLQLQEEDGALVMGYRDDDEEYKHTDIRRNAKCILTGPTTLYSNEYPKERIVLPHAKRQEIIEKIGHQFFCELHFNQTLDCFVVMSDLKPAGDKPYMRREYANNQYALEIGVREVVDCQGLFHSEHFGYIDDPHKLLYTNYFTKYRESICRVTVIDSVPTRIGHFRIVGVEESKKNKLRKFMQENAVCVSDTEAVVYSLDGTALAICGWPMAKIRFDSTVCPGWRRMKPGTKIKMDIRYEPGMESFVVTKFTELPDTIRVCQTAEGMLLFQTKAVWDRGILKNLAVLTSSVFGPLDDLKDECPRKPAPNKEYDLWVAVSSAGSASLPAAHTPFNVYSCGLEQPPNTTEPMMFIEQEPVRPVEQAKPRVRFALPTAATARPDAALNAATNASEMPSLMREAAAAPSLASNHPPPTRFSVPKHAPTSPRNAVEVGLPLAHVSLTPSQSECMSAYVQSTRKFLRLAELGLVMDTNPSSAIVIQLTRRALGLFNEAKCCPERANGLPKCGETCPIAELLHNTTSRHLAIFKEDQRAFDDLIDFFQKTTLG
ncbi:unnamed protein product, partial [Mesorhabditis spiculigera]